MIGGTRKKTELLFNRGNILSPKAIATVTLVVSTH